MKLRGRPKCALGSIKQEDTKAALNIAADWSISKAIPDSNHNSLDIKQEDTKDCRTLLKQQDKFGSKGYYYRCDICNKRLPNLKSVLEHRKSNHISRLYNSTTIVKNLDKEPDLHNPDFYCESCEKSYNNKHKYRCHLRNVHYMVLQQLPKPAIQDTDIAPDPNDPNLHCRACDFTYKHKDTYKRHCRYAHGLKPVESASQASSSGSLTDTYCQTCEKRLSNIQNYRKHLFLVHKIVIRQPQRRRNDILPNADNPNFYCHSCEKKFGSKAAFTQHLNYVHSIFKSAPPQTELKPDVDDPNNYCSACQKTYSSKDSYRTHLRKVHQMILPSLRVKFNHKQLPDPYNCDYYCSVCKKKYPQAYLYRGHCKTTHFMTLEHPSIVNPNAEINVNDPDLYCSQCEHSFSKKTFFKKHLARVHSII